MIKRLLLIILFILTFTRAAFAQEVYRVTSVNFDTSHSLIVLTSPDNTTEAIIKNVKLLKLQNPKRAYFDIDSAVLTTASQNWFFNTGGVKQVRVAQFSTNPNRVRVTMYLDDDFDQSKISFLKVNNNIVINLKSVYKGIAKNEYFQNTYRDEKSTSSDFYENLSISNDELEKVKIAVNVAPKDEVLSQIQQAFNSSTAPAVIVKPVSQKSPEVINKELKLKSKYYLNLISPKSNGFLVNGFGVVGIEKPMYLTNPSRVCFDIPNTIVNSALRNKEFKIDSTDTVKIGQYGISTARLVITSLKPEKYYPVFAADGQSIIFINTEDIDTTSLFEKTNDAVAYYVKKSSSLTSEFIIAFNAPVIHSLRRDSSKLTMNFYNTLRYNDQTFKSTIGDSYFSDMEIDLLPKVGLKLTLPLERNAVVNTYLGSDGKSVKIVIKGVVPKKRGCLVDKTLTLPKVKGRKSVVLDPGHGGSDYGAIRSGINEKDINLDIAKRVQAILSSRGISANITRNKDEFVSLQDRTIFSANICPDIFVSIHVNSSSKQEISGVETHYYHQESLDLAQTVHASMVSNIKTKDRGLFKSKFYVINHTSIPAILVEVGFLSNDEERAKLITEGRKQQTATAIADGIIDYLNKN